jgi:hypothetical protein
MSASVATGRRILFAFLAGMVKRWHTHSYTIRPQDVAQHSFGVATCISLLHPDPSARLLKAALHHDLPELKFGDMPRWAKRETPEITAMLARGEDALMDKYEFVNAITLDNEEKQWLDGADLFDAWMFLMQNQIAQNHMMDGDFIKATRELRRWFSIGRLPQPIIEAHLQICAMYPWVKIY